QTSIPTETITAPPPSPSAPSRAYPTAAGGTSPSSSLDRDRLGQIPRLIDIEALRARERAGEDLQRHHGDQRHHQGRGLRHPEDHVGELRHRLVALLGDDERAGTAGADLLDVG